MPESSRTTQHNVRWHIAIAYVIATALAALVFFGGALAALGGWLAQPAFALATSWWRGSRMPGDVRQLMRLDAWPLIALWGVALAAIATLLVWPLTALRQTGSLSAVLGFSALLGVCLLGLWRTWPLWHLLEQQSSDRKHWRRVLEHSDISAWRGLGVAALIAIVLAGALLLAWPDLLNASAHHWLALAYVLLLPVVHWAVQLIAPASELSSPFDEAHDEPVAEEDAEIYPARDLDAALYAAARAGRVDAALQFITAGANPQALPTYAERDQRSLPMLAAVLPDLRLLRALITRGVNINAAHHGSTPLLAATRDSWHGRPEAVMTLLANGADPRIADSEGNTPLHHAARSTDPGVAALLRDAAAEIDALNHEGQSPLAMACAAGNWRMAKFLLERGARPEPAHGQSTLLAAANGEEDDAAGVQLLLKHKARVDVCDTHGRSALHLACGAGHVDIATALLAAGANPELADRTARTPWLEAARGGHLAVLAQLLGAKNSLSTAAINACDCEGRNALMLASLAENATPELLQRLCALGINKQHADHTGKTALDHAVERGRWDLIAVIDPDYVLPSRVAADVEPEPELESDTPIHMVDERPPLQLLREGLIESKFDGLDVYAAQVSADDLSALLTDPDTALSPEQISWLLMHGANAEIRNADGDTYLFAQLDRGAPGVPTLQMLLQHAISPAGAGGMARFLAACVAVETTESELETFALDLLACGADPFAPSPVGDAALGLAVRLDWQRLSERLLDIGVDPDASDHRGMTALHLAAALGREALVKSLIARGANPEARAADGQTPLGVALSAGRRDLADWLDWRGWALPRRLLRASDVPAAAIVGDADAVRRLLDLGMPADAIDTQGCTALLRAAGGGHRATVDLLLSRGADPQHGAYTGATPLSAAVSMRQGEIVDRLLASGATLEQRLPGDVTVLMLAAALGLPDLTARLLTAGANIAASDGQGFMPLHCAALYGFTARERPRLVALLDTLLLAGADADARAEDGATPLLLLLGARAEPGTACAEDVVMAGMERLLDEDVSLDAQDARGFSPLHLAALHGLSKVVQRLLRAGANPEQRDTLNRTAREIATMRGYTDVAIAFEPAVPVASMGRFLREPR